MRCSEIKLLISEYFDDELNDIQKRAVEEHILICDRCYREFTEMRELVSLLQNSLAPYRVNKENMAQIFESRD